MRDNRDGQKKHFKNKNRNFKKDLTKGGDKPNLQSIKGILSVGDELPDLVVINIGDMGDGIAKFKKGVGSSTNGITIIINQKGLQVDQRVDVRIRDVRDKFAFADVI